MLRRPDLRIHDIRHWVAASLLRNGVGVGVASQILGHRDQTMLLRRYGHLSKFGLKEDEKSLVRARDFSGLLSAGGNIYFLIKLGVVTVNGLYYMGAKMRGESYEQFLSTRNNTGAT